MGGVHTLLIQAVKHIANIDVQVIRVGVSGESERLYKKIRWSSLTVKIVDSDANMAASEILKSIWMQKCQSEGYVAGKG